MSARTVSVTRAIVVGLYALTGALLAGGGMTGGEFATMVVLGVVALTYVVLADWINAGSGAS